MAMYCSPDYQTSFLSQLSFRFKRRRSKQIFKMAAMAADTSYEVSRQWGRSIQEKKGKIDF